MTATDLASLTLAEAAAAIAAGDLSPVELTDACLDRIERLDPALNAFITVTAETARREARAAQDGTGPSGPLRGVPIALKDLFDTAGVRTTGGTKILADRVPERDATVTARLRQAGAVFLGKLNMHEFAYGVSNDNPHYGPTRNPWDTARIPGGSSGGSGAAVAAGLCLGTLGSDTGGSIRIPASLCGITGLKPTYGRVSRAGVLPLSWSMDHIGPMARTVRDCAILLSVIAGHDPDDPASAAEPVPDYLAELEDGVRGLRVGLPRRYFFEQVDDQVRAAVEEAARILQAEGAELRDVDIDEIELAPIAGATILVSEAAAYHERWLNERPEDYGDDVRQRLLLGRLYPATTYINAQRLRRTVVESFLRALAGVDLLLAPATPITAPPIAGFTTDVRASLTRFTTPINLAGLPSLALPCGFDRDTLPIGMQLIGRPFAEALLLRAGRAYERATDWHSRRPPDVRARADGTGRSVG
jgi:aspartyl-tRNA(Asn)/glutamyl-tRNA(Gln) amidotransferase subunit A